VAAGEGGRIAVGPGGAVDSQGGDMDGDDDS
jgi:hypothetical protein